MQSPKRMKTTIFRTLFNRSFANSIDFEGIFFTFLFTGLRKIFNALGFYSQFASNPGEKIRKGQFFEHTLVIYDVSQAKWNDIKSGAEIIFSLVLLLVIFWKEMTIETDKFYEKVCHSFNVCLNDKFLRRSKGREALFRGSDRYRHHKVDEVVIGTVGENFHLRTFVSGVFGFAELQENGTYGLKHTLILRTNKVQALSNRVGWTDAEVDEKCLSWNVPPYTPVEPHDAKLTYHSKSKAPIESR